MNSNAAVAFSRFGLGRRRGEAVPADPRGWLTLQLDGPDPSQFPGLPASAEALAMVDAEQRTARDAAMEAARQPGQKRQPTPEQQALNDLHKRERAALLANAITTEAGFRERLVLFWYNHFTVAARTRPAI